MRPYRCLLFDLDNTLMDFDMAERAAFTAACSAVGLSASETSYSLYHEINDLLWKKLERGKIARSRLLTLRFETLLNRLGFPDDSRAQSLSTAYFAELAQQRYLVPGAREVCAALASSYKLYLITNGTLQIQMSRLHGSGLEEFFSDVFVSEQVGAAKPSLHFFDAVFSRIGDSERSHYCVIGDSLSSDIAGAEAARLDAVWIDRSGRGDAHGHALMRMMKDIRELPAYFLGCPAEV